MSDDNEPTPHVWHALAVVALLYLFSLVLLG
jgi:hypothetical protein